MTGIINSPADILRWCLVARGQGTSPALNPMQEWPVFKENEPDSPDKCMTVYNTPDSVDSGRIAQGEVIEFPGCQIRFRAKDEETAYTKMMSVAENLDLLVRQTVTMPGGEPIYIVAWVRRRPLGYKGKEKPTSRRYITTLNVTLSLHRSD